MNAAPEVFSTTRLEAHRVGRCDEAFVAALFTDARVTDTLGGPRDAARVADDLERWDAHWREHGFGMWILRDRGSGEPVGWTMLTATEAGGTGGVEVGWTIIADRWREGLAFEAGVEAIRIAFDVIRLDEVVSFALPHNAASRGVMEKIGFRFESEVDHAGLPHVLYRLDRQTWENERG